MRLLSFALVSLLFVPALVAQPRPATAVLAQVQEAVGGEALTGLHTLDAWARCTAPAGWFRTRLYAARRGDLRFEQLTTEGRFVLFGRTEGEPWRYDQQADAFTALAPPMQAFLEGHNFHLLALLPTVWLGDPTATDTTTFSGQPAHALRFTDAAGAPLWSYYDRETHLPLGLTLRNPFETGADEIVITFADWREVAGVRLFHHATIAHGPERFTYAYEHLRLNGPTPARFARDATVTVDPDYAAIADLHRQQQAAHLTYDPDRLVAMLADPVTQARRGTLARQTAADNRARFAAYFGSVHFREWADVEPPRIRISPDGQMAYALLHKRVRHVPKDAPDGPETDTIFVWMEAWEKVDGAWTLKLITSTDRPGGIE